MNRKTIVLAFALLLLLPLFTMNNVRLSSQANANNLKLISQANGGNSVELMWRDRWPAFHHDPAHTGYCTSTAPKTNDTLWTYTSGGCVRPSPAVADGMVFMHSDDNNTYALNEFTGTKIWSYPTGGTTGSPTASASSPAVADGLVFIGSYDNNVYALNEFTGKKIWNYPTESHVSSSPAVADGMVFIASQDDNAYALDESTGSLRWHYTTGNMVLSSPAVADGLVFIASCDHNVYALNESTGTKIWNYTTGITKYTEYSSPAVADGMVFIASQDDNVYALDESTGSLRWKYATARGISWSSPAVADGLVFIASDDNRTYCIGTLPTVTFKASFMTPQGEPYPFDDVVISDGVWKQEFTNVTSIDTKVHYNSTYTLTYEFNGVHRLERFIIPFEPNDNDTVRAFNVYAIDPETIALFTPYIILKESGITSINHTWVYNATTGIFNYSITTDPPGKYVAVDVSYTYFEKPPYCMVKEVGYGDIGINPENYYVPYDPNSNSDIPIINYDYGHYGSLQCRTIQPPLPESYFEFRQVFSTIVGIQSVTYKDSFIRPFDLKLQMLNGTSYDPEYLLPQFDLPDGAEGNYLLNVYGLPPDYCQLSLPIDTAGDYNVFDVYAQRASELRPYTFNTTAEFFPDTSKWYNLSNDASTRTLSVDVQDSLVHPWWGCFVLPKDRMVGTLTAYSGSASYQLKKFYNYTETLVGDYNIITVRMAPEMDRLSLTYTGSADVNGDGIVNILDISIVAKAYGSKLGDPNWNQIADLDGNGQINILDISLVAKQYGKTV